MSDAQGYGRRCGIALDSVTGSLAVSAGEIIQLLPLLIRIIPDGCRSSDNGLAMLQLPLIVY